MICLFALAPNDLPHSRCIFQSWASTVRDPLEGVASGEKGWSGRLGKIQHPSAKLVKGGALRNQRKNTNKHFYPMGFATFVQPRLTLKHKVSVLGATLIL